MVAPRAASPAPRSATASPCGRPPGAVRPRPITFPSFTRMAPTAGFGQVAPRPPAPSRIAAARKRRSSSSAILLDAGIVAGEPAHKGLEILRLAKIAIDGGEAHIGHVVEVPQPLHDEQADLFGGNLLLAAAFQLPHDAGDHALDALR